MKQKSTVSAATMTDKLMEYLLDLITEKDRAKPVLDKIEWYKKLPSAEREAESFFLYLEIEKFIVTHKPPVVKESHTAESLRNEIKETFGVKGFSPRLSALYRISGAERIIFSELILESLIKQMGAAVEPSRIQSVIDEITRGKLIEGIKLKKDGVDFSASERKIFSVSQPWFGLIGINYRNLISALYWRARDELGEEKAGKILEDAHKALQEKYGHLPVASSIITVMPEDFLTKERELRVLADCYAEFINTVGKILVRGEIKGLKKDVSQALTSVLKGTRFNRDGSFDFSVLFENKAIKEDGAGKLTEAFSKLISALYWRARDELGEETAGSILENAYKSVREKYGAIPVSSQVLRAVPEGVLEMEKLELRAREELEKGVKRVDMLRGEFATVAAHELKGPLAPIITYTELLLKDKKHKLTPEQRKRLEIIFESAYREKELVEDIMDISKLESGVMKFDMQNVQIASIIKKGG